MDARSSRHTLMSIDVVPGGIDVVNDMSHVYIDGVPEGVDVVHDMSMSLSMSFRTYQGALWILNRFFPWKRCGYYQIACCTYTAGS